MEEITEQLEIFVGSSLIETTNIVQIAFLFNRVLEMEETLSKTKREHAIEGLLTLIHKITEQKHDENESGN
jgi:uncharacterized membrane protein YadS